MKAAIVVDADNLVSISGLPLWNEVPVINRMQLITGESIELSSSLKEWRHINGPRSRFIYRLPEKIDVTDVAESDLIYLPEGYLDATESLGNLQSLPMVEELIFLDHKNLS